MTRYALRVLVTPWLVVLQVPFSVVLLLKDGSPWRGELLWAVDWQAIGLVTLGPLLVAAVAVDTSRLGSEGRAHLLVLTSRLRRPQVFVLLAGVAPLAAVHLMTLLVALVWGGAGVHGATQGPDALLSVLVQMTALGFYACIGSLIGRAARPRTAGILGVLTGLGLLYAEAGGVGEGFRLLELGGAAVSRLGLALSTPYALLQAGIFLCAGALCVWAPVRFRGERLRLGPLAMATGAFVAVLVVVALPGLPADRLLFHPTAPHDCSGHAPQICTFAEHARMRPRLVAVLEPMVAAARSHGYEAFVPARVTEQSRTYTATPGVPGPDFAFAYDDLTGGRLDTVSLARDLLSPAHCPQLTGAVGPPDRFWADLDALTATWSSLLGATDAPAGGVVLTPSQAADLVGRFGRCELDGPAPG